MAIRKQESRSESRAHEQKMLHLSENRSEHRFEQHNQRFEHMAMIEESSHRIRTDSPIFNETSFFNSSRSPSPTSSSGQRKTPLPIKTPTSMQRAASVKSQNYQIYQNQRSTPRVYQSNAELYHSMDKLEIPQSQPQIQYKLKKRSENSD